MRRKPVDPQAKQQSASPQEGRFQAEVCFQRGTETTVLLRGSRALPQTGRVTEQGSLERP